MSHDDSREFTREQGQIAPSTSTAGEIAVPNVEDTKDDSDASEVEDIPVAHAVVLADDEVIPEPECSAEAISGPVEGTPLLARSNCAAQNHSVDTRCYKKEYQTGAIVIFVLTAFLAACVFIVEEFGGEQSGSSSAGPPRTTANTSSVSVVCVSGHAAPTFFMVGSDADATGIYQTDVTTSIENLVDITTPRTVMSASTTNVYFSPSEAWGIDLKINSNWMFDDECANESQTTTFISNSTVAATAVISDYSSENTPQRMSVSYGEYANQLDVFMILREPIAASQAAFYFSRRRALRHSSENKRRHLSYEVYIRQQLRYVNECGSTPTNSSSFCTEAEHRDLEKWLYGFQIQRWLEYFDPRKITIVSYDMYLRDRAKTVRDTAKVIGLSVREGATSEVFTREISEAETHAYIENDLETETLDKLKLFFKLSNYAVYRTLEESKIRVIPTNVGSSEAFLDYPSSGGYPYRNHRR